MEVTQPHFILRQLDQNISNILPIFVNYNNILETFYKIMELCNFFKDLNKIITFEVIYYALLTSF